MIRRGLLLALLLPGAAAFQVPSHIARATGTNDALCSTSRLNLSSESQDRNNGAAVEARRSFCVRSLATLAGGASFLASPLASYAADAVKLESYDDPDFNFSVGIPSSWETTEQKLSGRRKAIFFTDPTSKDATTGTVETLGFIAYTPLRDDFTSLASFGSVDEVAQTTILPKGELAGGDTSASKMLSAVSKNNAYYFDYVATPVVPTEPATSGGAMTKTLKPQHFRTIFTLLPLKGAAGLTLVTVTLQTSEERYGDVKEVFDQVIGSYAKSK